MKTRVGLVLALSLAACTPVTPRESMSAASADLIANAEREGLTLADPAILDADMKQAMEREVGRQGTPGERMLRLRRWLHDDKNPYQHDPLLTADAPTTFHVRKGGCMSHAVLMVTLARYLGVDAYYVQATSARRFADRGDTLVAMTHMAVGYREGAQEGVIDVWIPLEDWRLVRYERIDDDLVLALYHSNLAVEDLSPAQLPQDEKELRYLAGHARTLPQVVNNLIAVLLRQKKYEEALLTARDAIDRFPRFKPLYTNGYLAAVGSGEQAYADCLLRAARALKDEDPVFVVARGVSDFENGHYDEAAAQFEKALVLQPDSVVVHAWLVRARFATGNARAASDVFARAWRLAPEDPRLVRMLLAHPELRADRR